jgi:hypothetical protein
MLAPPMRRVLPFVAILAIGVVSARVAPAQSAAELEAARGLFKQGGELEKNKEYAAAYEKFRKVAEIKSTAIVRYHEGFCAEKIGKWVEALDAWSRAQIDGQGDPKQKDAVEASRKAADALRPRVPRIKVKVEGAKGKPQVSIDGAVVSAVLLEEGLPVNVGPHTVEISGGGNASDKQDVTVAEKEIKEVVFTAKEAGGGGGVVVPPDKGGGGKGTGGGAGAGTGAGLGAGSGSGVGGATGGGTGAGAGGGSGAAGGKDAGDIARFGLVFGLSVSSLTPSGQIYGPANESTQTFVTTDADGKRNTDVSQWMSTGAAIEVDVGFRFIPILAAYGFWQHGWLGVGTVSKEATNYKVTTDAFGLGLMLNTNPRKGFGFYADLALAYRSTSTSQDVVTESATISAKLTGIEPLRLKLGLAYKPSVRFTLVAFVWAAAGAYTKVDYNGLTASKVYDVDQTATHSFAGIGLGGFYDLPLGKQ